MKIRKPVRTLNVLKSIFNIRNWSDYDRMKMFTQYLYTGIKKMFIPRKSTIEDTKNTFDTVVSTMNLTTQELIVRQKGLYRLSIIMCVVACCLFSYSVYHLFYANFKAAIISLVITLIAMVLAFRYHFWYFQIKERKLGCTFQEWYRQGLLGDKK